MLARLKSIIFPPPNPSAVVVIGSFGVSIKCLHVVPEDGTIECFTTKPAPSSFRLYGATEQSRQQIGTVTVENHLQFMGEIEKRIRELWNKTSCLNLETQQQQLDDTAVSKLVQNVLQPAALSAIDAQEGRERSPVATNTHPVYIVFINRARPGKIVPSNLTSFG